MTFITELFGIVLNAFGPKVTFYLGLKWL